MVNTEMTDENVVKAELLQAEDLAYYERAYPLTIRADSTVMGDRNSAPARTNIKIANGNPQEAVANRRSFGQARVVEKEGLALDECERFELGERGTLYVPLFFKVVPRTPNGLKQHPGGGDEMPQAELYFKSTNKAIASPQFDTTKVEMAILMRQAADVAFGITKSDRRRLHRHIDTNIVGDSTWAPDGLGDDATKTLSLALLQKAGEVCKIQADQGKVWRSKDTVAHIRKGAITVAAAYNNVLLQDGLLEPE